MCCHLVMSYSDLLAFTFTFVFTCGQKINCFQLAAFTVFLRDGEGPHVGVHVCKTEVFVGPSGTTLTTNGIQMFCELDNDFW